MTGVQPVPVDGRVLALGVHDVDDDGVRVDVVGGAGVVPSVSGLDRGYLKYLDGNLTCSKSREYWQF